MFGGTDRFSVIRRLGEGGMGVVYLARDRERDGVVALKTLPAPDPSKILRLKSEFRTLAGVAHANLIQLYELVSDGNHWFFTMEYVAGQDFVHHVVGAHLGDFTSTMDGAAAEATVRASQTPEGVAPITAPVIPGRRSSANLLTNIDPVPFQVDEDRLRPALRQLVSAIHSLHGAGILHLDVKPSNVLVTPSGRVVVLDFGLATRFRGRELDAAESVTMRGTPAYMAPEQMGEGMGEASDWYGVGVLLYEALTRRLPFVGSMWEILHQKMESEPPPPSAHNPLVPADLDDLCVALLRPRPPDRLTGPEVLKRLRIDAPTPLRESQPLAVLPTQARALVGRDREVSELCEAVALVREGTAVSVLVHGTSGVGKTVLVEGFLDELAGEARILRSRCYERESVPYKAFDGLIDALVSELALMKPGELAIVLPPQTAALARLFPVLTRLPEVEARVREEAVAPDALERRRHGFAGLRELLRRLADQKLLVVVLDDLQWADHDSRVLLADILRPPGSPELLLLGMYRDEDVARSAFLRGVLAATPEEVGVVRKISVGPLPADKVRELALRNMADGDPDREAKAELVARESRGHPYFVAELVFELEASASGPMLSLDALIDRRVKRLPALARELLEVVAIAGRPLSQTLLLAAQRAGAPADRPAEESALATLQALNMIRTSGARTEDQVEAYHDRVRETVASHLSPEHQRDTHRKLAVTMEAAGADAAELAPHFHAAGELLKAAHHAARAAEHAERTLAFDRAAAFLRMALESSPGAPASVTQPWIERLAEALKNGGRAAEAAAAYQRAADSARSAVALELRRRAAEQLLVSGHLDTGSELLGSVLRAVGLRLAGSPTRALASVVAQRAFLKVRGLRYEVRPKGTLADEELTRIDMCWSVAVGLSMVDNVRAADFQARHLLLSLRSGDLERITRALTFEVGFVAGPGSATDVASGALLRESGELARRVGTPYATGFHTLMAGVREYLAGRWTRAFELAEAAEHTLRERCSGLTWEVTNAQRFALGSLMYQGDMLEVLRRLPGLLRHAHERGNLYVATDLRTRIALPWLAIDDPARVEHEIEDAFAHWTDQGFHLQHFNALMALGHKDLYTGDPERARTRLADQAKRLKRSLVLRLQVPRIEVMYLRARLALAIAARRKGTEVQSLLEDASRDATAIEAERAPWAMPLAGILHAAVAAARGERPALERFERAARGLDAVDMHLHAAVARFRAGELEGGVRGKRLVDDARQFMVERGVKVPEQFVAMFAPGPWSGAQ
ncbi:MAG: AAA family ATPase [Kofleriaceae bacterium]